MLDWAWAIWANNTCILWRLLKLFSMADSVWQSCLAELVKMSCCLEPLATCRLTDPRLCTLATARSQSRRLESLNKFLALVEDAEAILLRT